MADCMMFPKDWKEFLEDYSFKDKEEVYTNGSKLIPTFRVEQMIEHFFAADNNVGHWIIHHAVGGRKSRVKSWAECSECHVCGSPQWKVCPVCETRMEKHSAINIEEVAEVEFDYAAEDDND